MLDQDEALEFYVRKLGLEIHTDADLGFMRWLTVIVPGDPARQILLERPGPPSLDETTAEQVRAINERGDRRLADLRHGRLPKNVRDITGTRGRVYGWSDGASVRNRLWTPRPVWQSHPVYAINSRVAVKQSTTSSQPWAGRIVLAFVVLFLLFDVVIHVLNVPPVVSAFAQLGFPDRLASGIGFLEFICLIAYVIPRTSFLGAILLTASAYLEPSTAR